MDVIQDKQVADTLNGQSYAVVMAPLAGWAKLPTETRVRLAKKLLPALHSTARVGFPDPGDITIDYRLKTGEMKLSVMGVTTHQDLYLTGGRAAFALSWLVTKNGQPDYDLPHLNGGLTAGEWNKRALAIEAKVNDYFAGSHKRAKPSAPVAQVRECCSPHVFPAVNGVLTLHPLFAPTDDPWRTPKVILLTEQLRVTEFLTTRKWARVKAVWEDFRLGFDGCDVRIAGLLLAHLRDTAATPVEGADDLLLPYRIGTGELKPSERRKYNAGHDVFLMGGRAAYGLRGVMGQNSGPNELHGGLTVDEWEKRAKVIEGQVKTYIEQNTPKKKK